MHNNTHPIYFVCAAFQTTVLQMLVKMRGDLKDVNDRLDHATTLLMTLTEDMHEQDEELHLPTDVQLPVQSVEDMGVLEEALKDAQFRRRMVCKSRLHDSARCCKGHHGFLAFTQPQINYV